jgi:hypothetical protein
MIEAGALTPVIDRRYRVDQVVAYRYVEIGQKIGDAVSIVEPAS